MMNWFKRMLSKLNFMRAIRYFIDKEDIFFVMMVGLGALFSFMLGALWFINLGISDVGMRTFIVTNLVWIVPTIIGNYDIQKTQNEMEK